jgi:hypothetical protein
VAALCNGRRWKFANAVVFCKSGGRSVVDVGEGIPDGRWPRPDGERQGVMGELCNDETATHHSGGCAASCWVLLDVNKDGVKTEHGDIHRCDAHFLHSGW